MASAEYQREYRLKNREKRLTWQREWRKKNYEKYLAQKRSNYQRIGKFKRLEKRELGARGKCICGIFLNSQYAGPFSKKLCVSCRQSQRVVRAIDALYARRGYQKRHGLPMESLSFDKLGDI